MSMLAEFLTDHQITPEALVATSARLEQTSNEDRELRVKRATARREKKSYEELSLGKPGTLGRGLSLGMANRALSGIPVRRLVRQKIVRAVNAQLTSQKKDAIDWRALFADVPPRKSKKEK